MGRHFLAFSVFVMLSISSFSLNAGRHHQSEPDSWLKMSTPTIILTATAALAVAYCVLQQDIPVVDLPQNWQAYCSVSLLQQLWQAGVNLCSSTSHQLTYTLSHDLVSDAGRIKYLLSSLPHEKLIEVIDQLPWVIANKIPEAHETLAHIIQDGIASLSDTQMYAFIDAIKEFSELAKANPDLISFWDKHQLIRMYLRHFDVCEKIADVIL